MKTRTLATWVFGLGWILALGSAAGQETPGKEVPAPKVPIPEAAVKSKPPLTGWSFEVAKLVQAGVQDSVTLTFITNSAGTFNLGAEQIIALRELGVSNELLQAMIAQARLKWKPLTLKMPQRPQNWRALIRFRFLLLKLYLPRQ